MDSPRVKRILINSQDHTEDIQQFRAMIRVDSIAPGRVGTCLVAEMFWSAVLTGSLDPGMVLDEMRALEGRGKSNTKPPTPFTGSLLRGLWHKHHMVSGVSSMAENILHSLRKHGLPYLEQRLAEAEASRVPQYVTVEDIRLIADDAVQGALGRRAREAALTGEWIVYAIHEGKNYFLCLGGHKEGDAAIRAKIDTFCRPEFPFLADLLDGVP